MTHHRFRAITFAAGVILAASAALPAPAFAAGLSAVQIQAILSVLASFGVDAAVIQRVSLALGVGGGIAASPSISAVDGPTALLVGGVGTWDVSASVPGQPAAPLSYRAHWGDESSASAMSQTQSNGTFTHRYAMAGSYTPFFEVTSGGRTATSSAAAVLVQATTQTASLSAAPSSGTAPLTVVFTGSTGSTCDSHSFTFTYGDGQSTTFVPSQGSCAFSQTHTYLAGGTYIARIADSSGNSYTSATVTVASSMSATIDAGTLTSTSGFPSFTGSASGVSSLEVFISGSGTSGYFSEGSDQITVSYGRWTYSSSRTVPLANGSYSVTVRDWQTQTLLGTYTLTVARSY